MLCAAYHVMSLMELSTEGTGCVYCFFLRWEDRVMSTATHWQGTAGLVLPADIAHAL